MTEIHCEVLSVVQVAVAVKTLKKGSSLEQKVDFLSEAEMMKRYLSNIAEYEEVWI